MLEILDSIRNILSSFVSDKNPVVTPRKRRLSRDVETFRSKMRRLDDFSTLRCSSPIDDLDTPSSSKSIFKKPFYPSNKPFMRPTEVIDLSDDDEIEFKNKKQETPSHSSSEEWIDSITKKNISSYWEKSNFFNRFKKSELDKRHESILNRAKSSIARSNEATKWKKSQQNSLDESIRLDEYAKYKTMINSHRLSQPFIFNGNSTKKKEKTSNDTPFSEFYKKTLQEFNQPKTIIDLTNDVEKSKTISIDSDSDSDVKIVSQKVISPFNSLKKRLEIEPVVSQKWITEWDSNYLRKIEEKKKQIEDYQIQREKFRDINKKNIQFRLEESLKNCLRIQEIIIEDEEPEERLNLPELTENQERIISNVLLPGKPQQVFIDKFNLSITRADLQTLKGLNWLNDEVINFYTSLITERGNGKNSKMPRVHSMNTFFYPKLMSHGYDSLRRWTKKVDIFAQDLVVIPVHLGVHWCMSIIDFRDKTIKYFDSMGSPNQKCLQALLEYLKREHQDKKKTEFDTSNWKLCSVRDIPQQMNGSDCGVFACMYAEFITRNAKILFTQEHMPYFRKKMVLEIVTGELLLK